MERTAILNKEKNFVSCVLYLHNDGAHIRDFLNTVCGTMEEHFEKYEIVCVNDCCMDNTIEEIHRFLEESRGNHVVSMINLSFYQGVEMAMNAGRDLAVGDFLFEFDRCLPDFEPSLIMDVYYRALEGYDVVAAAPGRDVALTSRLFYAVYNLGSRNTHKLRQERFRIISRRAVNRVNQMNAYIPYRKAMYMNCGLRADTLVYENKKKAGSARNREERSTRSSLALDTLIIFTNVLEKFSGECDPVLCDDDHVCLDRVFDLQHGTSRGRLDESHDADIVWIFHDVRHADVDLQISVRDLEYEL